MICYRDMTFCTYHRDCRDAEGCVRALTQGRREAAREWWGAEGEPPICVFAERPDCHKLVVVR